MTQRIFDVENEKDMADLWDILPHNINIVIRYKDKTYRFFEDGMFIFECSWLRINWHDKTEITRPIPEATEADIGKMCKFWDDEEESCIGILIDIIHMGGCQSYRINLPAYKDLFFLHCRRLTKQEIEELC